MREIKENLKREIYVFHELESSMLLRKPFFPHWSIDSMQSLLKSKQIFLLGEIDKLILKLVCKYRRPRIVKINFIKDKVGGLVLTGFMTL